MTVKAVLPNDSSAPVKLLIAEDDPISRLMLQGILQEWGYDVTAVADGAQAWEALQRPDAPRLAVVDWVMPVMDGVELCRKLREQATAEPVYVLLLTARDGTANIVEGLQSGANDYVTKPFDRDELLARVRVGQSVVALQHSLALRVRELEEALGRIKRLQGLLPICMYCRKVRDDQNYWREVEDYIVRHTDARFSHGICPDCFRDVVGPQMRATGQKKADEG